jgi:pyruvate-formate lyase
MQVPLTPPERVARIDPGSVQRRPTASAGYNFATELRFTEVYRRYAGSHRALCEAACLKVQFPATLGPVERPDLFAGRVRPALVGFSPDEWGQAAFGYYCLADDIRAVMDKGLCEPALRLKLEEMIAFWQKEQTSARVRNSYPPEMAAWLPSDDWMGEPGIAFPLYRLTGASVDFRPLLRLGIEGMMKRLTERRAAARLAGEDVSFFDGMTQAVMILHDACRYYEDVCRMEAAIARPERRSELLTMADVLGNLVLRPPRSFREAAQLFWLYSLISDVRNYGRMDVYLGSFLARDLDAGILTEETALRLLQSLWKLMADRGTRVHGRVVVGGMGRPDPEAADRFALLAIEATRTVPAGEPQLSLRWHEEMNPLVLERAMEALGEGRTFPILYNDEVNIPSVMHAFQVDHTTAEQYVPFGCGEYVIEGESFGTPSGVINLLKALEVTLHNGRDPVSGKTVGLALGHIHDFATFEDLWKAYTAQVEHFVGLMAEQEKLVYDVAGASASFLLPSLLYDDCFERGKALFDGGIRYLGGTLETYGNSSTADSLLAIKDLVYDRKLVTPDELLAALDADFEGYPHVRRLLRSVPKYGNDDEAADDMLCRVHEHVCNFTQYQADRVGLHTYLVVVINNSANALMGRWTAASADGRRACTPMNNGNAPSSGNDRNGVTAVLNSMVKPRTDIHAGAVQNLKFGRDLFTKRLPETNALIRTYFAKGGAQLMITVVNRDDLLRAIEEPEAYAHIFVRVGGFSSRFIDLPRDVQREIIERTLY